MRFKSVISAAALVTAMGLGGVAQADTMVNGLNVTDVDLPRVQAYCEQLASGMEADEGTDATIDPASTDAVEGDDGDDEASSTDGSGAGTEPTLDISQITLEGCVEAGLATEGDM